MPDATTATAPAAAIPQGMPEVNPLIDVLNKLQANADAKMQAVLEAQQKQLADAMSKQTEALKGFAEQVIKQPLAAQPGNLPGAPAQPQSSSKGVDVWPVLQRLFNDVSFRDKVVALHTTFPAGS